MVYFPHNLCCRTVEKVEGSCKYTRYHFIFKVNLSSPIIKDLYILI